MADNDDGGEDVVPEFALLGPNLKRVKTATGEAAPCAPAKLNAPAVAPVHAPVQASAGPMCNCNQPAKEMVSGPQAKNPNRAFLCCPKGRNDASACKFWSWKDEWLAKQESGGAARPSATLYPVNPQPVLRSVAPTIPVQVAQDSMPKSYDDLRDLLTERGFKVTMDSSFAMTFQNRHMVVTRGDCQKELYARVFLRDARTIEEKADVDYGAIWLPVKHFPQKNWLKEDSDADLLAFQAGPVGSKSFVVVPRRALWAWLNKKLASTFFGDAKVPGSEHTVANTKEARYCLYQLPKNATTAEARTLWTHVAVEDLIADDVPIEHWSPASAELTVPPFAP